jgi:hypothetical protein
LLVQLALVASVGLNVLTCLVLADQRRKGKLVMTQNADALNLLAGDVQNESSVVDSAIVLINGLANRLTDILSQSAGTEDLTTQIQALRDEINQRAVSTRTGGRSRNGGGERFVELPFRHIGRRDYLGRIDRDSVERYLGGRYDRLGFVQR